MPASSRQKRVEGRVLHEFKHGDLKSGPGGKGGVVKSHAQAVAIALREAGASRFKPPKANSEAHSRTKSKEAKGETAEQSREGRDHLGAEGQRESTKAVGGMNARSKTGRGAKAAETRAREPDGHTVLELRAMAARQGVPRRSRLTKQQLKNALGLS